jgi:hypothetical protein
MLGNQGSRYNPRLTFWDVPAAALGALGAMVLMAALRHVAFLNEHPGGMAPLVLPVAPAFVAAWRSLFPQLTPPPRFEPVQIGFLKRVGAYLRMIVGGLVALFSGLFLVAVMLDDRFSLVRLDALITVLVVLLIFTGGGLLAASGVRTLTGP